MYLRTLIVGDLRVMKRSVSIVAINTLICFDVNCETCGLDICRSQTLTVTKMELLQTSSYEGILV